jgi:hypothetical protein
MMATKDTITSTSTITVASAAPKLRPKREIATAAAGSKKI